VSGRWSRACGAAYGRLAGSLTAAVGDLRQTGSTQGTLALVAGGGYDAALVTARHPWDTVAGAYLVRRAGGRVTNLAGGRWTLGDEWLVASNGAAHEAVLGAARRGVDD